MSRCRSAGRAVLCATFALSVCSCRGLPSPDPELTARLETCSDDEDQELLLEAARDIEEGRNGRALEVLPGLTTRNPECARLVVLARRACSLVPLQEREASIASMGRQFGELYDKQDAAADSGKLEEDGRDNLAFGRALFAESDAEKREWLNVALRLNGDHYYALVLSGEDQWRRGQFDRAKSELKRALALRADLAEGWLFLALIAEEQNLPRTADRHYRAYLGLRPLDRKVRLNYTRFLIQNLRDGERAMEQARRLLKADPSSLEAGLHLAAAHWLLGETGEAELVYKDLLRRYPREARVALNLGNLYYDQKDPTNAWRAYRYLLSLPLSADPYALLGQALFVPSRIKEIEKWLGAELPPEPRSAKDLL